MQRNRNSHYIKEILMSVEADICAEGYYKHLAPSVIITRDDGSTPRSKCPQYAGKDSKPEADWACL
ncbi:hypothetical protein AGABI2DRAFT_195829 [Agaricus bisporus var. bisporus H97]|uniref:hypothetical protein n=1 Tax=Agaricus bisporus var. bisporus (strain H97 / ATCC MYA-4626 / FGSC 10389) TaxID=936046 RepID=UPI00029F7D6D|nr:hypothetical protein AGABI2DRAFT_195829 [Agaricus bisporus var. bisporus H97]EKV42509.1 hypothetical protein AGABI2DRAFT_195829 [Agaricus bisporus var. bisporus H97]